MTTIATDAGRLGQFPFAQVGSWLTQGSIIPFIGSGASRAASTATHTFPDGKGLADELCAMMEGAYPSEEAGNLAKVAQYFQHSVFDRSALYDHLHKRFEGDMVSAALGPVAVMLARVPRNSTVPLFMITTNYDSQIEKAFTSANRPLCLITQNMRDSEQGAPTIQVRTPEGRVSTEQSRDFQWQDTARFPSDTAFLYKMHGSVHESSLDGPDDVIITEDDYVDFMVNAGGSTSPFFPPPSLTAAYKRRRFLFLGYSLEDWNFRAFLRLLAVRNALSGQNARRHWAVQLEPPLLDVQLWGHRNVTVYDGDLQKFCEQLSESWLGRAET